MSVRHASINYLESAASNRFSIGHLAGSPTSILA